MEDQFLKAAWQQADVDIKSNDELKTMLLESRHPVLKRIRRQALWEALAFIAFLCMYYNFFDGDRKPFYANLLLVAGVALVVLHNLWGYLLTKKRIGTGDVKISLLGYARTIRFWGIASVVCRMLAVTCILLFFSSVIVFTSTKYWLLAGALLIILVQIVLLAAMWMKRLKEIRSVTDGLGA